METELIVPASYPINLINKDWSQRPCYYRKNCGQFLQLVHNMPVRNDDVWIVTLPKCGTTWMQELLWLVINDFDFFTAKNIDLEVRTPFMEFDYIINMDLQTALKPVENLKPPRLIKSHLPLPLLPKELWIKKPKVIYVYRNPKDSFVSEFYFGRSMGHNLDKTLEEYLMEKLSSDYGISSFDHVTEFYTLRHEPWLYYTSFECMKDNLSIIIKDICKFLNKSINDKQMEEMLKHLSFNEMKVNPKTNHLWEIERVRNKLKLPYEEHNFIRKGQVGGYKDEVSKECIAKMDKWILEQLRKYNVSLDELLLINQRKS